MCFHPFGAAESSGEQNLTNKKAAMLRKASPLPASSFAR
jgi:hypothetical protein